MGCFRCDGDELEEDDEGEVQLHEELVDALFTVDLGSAKQEVDDFDLLGVGDVSFGIGIFTALI